MKCFYIIVILIKTNKKNMAFQTNLHFQVHLFPAQNFSKVKHNPIIITFRGQHITKFHNVSKLHTKNINFQTFHVWNRMYLNFMFLTGLMDSEKSSILRNGGVTSTSPSLWCMFKVFRGTQPYEALCSC